LLQSRRLTALKAALLSLAVAPTLPLQAQETVCHYIEFPGAEPGTTQVHGINDYGDMAGGYTYRFGPDDDDLHEYGFAYIDGQWITLDVPGSSITVGFGINNQRQVVGSWNEIGFNKYPRGFFYSGGGYSTIDYTGSYFTQVFGIGNGGEITGNFAFSNPDEGPVPYYGFVRSAGGGFTLIDFAGATGSQEVWDVDARGTVLGWSPLSGGAVGFLWSGGQFLSTIEHPEAGATVAYGLNDAGTIVGFVLRSDLSQAGFIRSPEGEFTNLDCGGQLGAVLYGVNNLGAMVGTHLLGPGPFGRSFHTAPTLEILKETTRHKPQRSDAPIEVHFRGPHDLESAALEIKDPQDRDVTVDPPPELEPDPGGSPFLWRLSWQGPWTRNNPDTGQLERLPTGNYKVVVKGTRAGGMEIESEPYDKVSLVEVKRIELTACGSISGISCSDAGAVLAENEDGTGTPMPGGGKAAFPDAAQPGDDFRRSLLVKAEVEPDLGDDAGQVTVYFRAVDVDDPSASAGPVDNDAGTATDNRSETATIVPAVNGSPPRQGAAVSQFQVSTQQGNNYRLAASTHEPWLAGLSGVVSSQAGEVTHTSGETLTDGVQVSEMLTVWRTLHLEMAFFDPSPRTQADLQYQGFWTNLDRRRLDDATAPFFNVTVDGLLDHTMRNGWRGADVNPRASAGRDFRIEENTNRSLSVRPGNMCDVVPATFCNRAPASPSERTYLLQDDRLASLVDSGYDVSLLRGILNGVYVALATQPGPALPWVRNLTFPAQLGIQGTVPNSRPYWSVLFVHGFEPERERDHDPTDDRAGLPQPPVAGRWGPVSQQPNAIVFLEAIRDFVDTSVARCVKPTITFGEFYRGTTAHEVLHTLFLVHDGDATGGVMCSAIKNFANQPNRNAITEAQKATLRAVEVPGVFRNVPDSPGCTNLTC
jgi:hypothetical protein